METGKGILTAAITLLALILIVAVIPTERDGEIYEDTVRLHILANSDSRADQDLKLGIRDKLLEKYSTSLRSADSKEDALLCLSAKLGDIKSDIDTWLSDAGYEYESEVRLGKEWYERRDYGDFSLPEGYYTSLVIELGEAEGQNWWCVMYPPMCLDIATEEAPGDDVLLGYTSEEIALIESGGYTVRFKLLELTSGIFRGMGRGT